MKVKQRDKMIEQIEKEIEQEPQMCIVCESCDVDWELEVTGSPPYYNACCNWCGSSWLECLAFTHIENLELGDYY